MSTHDDDLPLDPAASLRLIQRERAEAERKLTPDPRLFTWPWGFAWLIGFTLFFLRFGPDGRVFVDMPAWLPLAALLGLTMLAGVFTGVAGARSSRHVTGPSSTQGIMYGLSWAIAFTGMSIALSRVTNFLPETQANLMWAGVMVALTGALHMAGGAVWGERPLFYLGVHISVVNVIGLIAGPGWHSLLIAVLCGAGMLVAGALGALHLRRQTAIA